MRHWLQPQSYNPPLPRSTAWASLMELDYNGEDNSSYASQSVLASTTTMNETSRASSDAAREADKNGRRVVDHDSLVTVRLSEPPLPHAQADMSPGSLPSSKSLCENEYTPSDAMAEALSEERDEIEGLQEPEEWDNTRSPTTTAPARLRNLQDELGEDDSPDDTDSIHSALDDADITRQESNDMSVITRSRSSEETNWDQLQEIEDKESRDHVSENVSASGPFFVDQLCDVSD